MNKGTINKDFHIRARRIHDWIDTISETQRIYENNWNRLREIRKHIKDIEELLERTINKYIPEWEKVHGIHCWITSLKKRIANLRKEQRLKELAWVNKELKEKKDIGQSNRKDFVRAVELVEVSNQVTTLEKQQELYQRFDLLLRIVGTEIPATQAKLFQVTTAEERAEQPRKAYQIQARDIQRRLRDLTKRQHLLTIKLAKENEVKKIA